MKLMKRIKDILFDEEEVEIPVIEKETTKIIEEENDSIKEIKMPEDDFSDKESFKSDLTFPFPIEFDEEELEQTNKIETIKREEPIKKEREYSFNRYDVKREEPKRIEREIKDYSSYLRNKEEKKQFKPTPIISPVYGVLDQNYKKEDLVVKGEIKRESTKKGKLDLDEIRKKAFGEEVTIEDTKELEVIELDEDIKIDPNKTIGELIEEEESIIFDEYDNTNDEVIIEETEEVEEMPTVELNDLIIEKESVEKKLASDLLEDEEDETDLFSLIDSMYEENNE